MRMKLPSQLRLRLRLRQPLVRLIGFVLIFAALYVGLSSYWGDGLSHWIIDVATVKPAAWLGRVLSGNQAIVASGAHLSAPDGSLTVLFGCEGSDVLMLLVAGILVAPSTWPRRLWGLVLGTALVFAVNQARVLALFFSFRLHRDWFGPIHGLLGPIVVVGAITVFFLAWLRWARPPGEDAGDVVRA